MLNIPSLSFISFLFSIFAILFIIFLFSSIFIQCLSLNIIKFITLDSLLYFLGSTNLYLFYNINEETSIYNMTIMPMTLKNFFLSISFLYLVKSYYIFSCFISPFLLREATFNYIITRVQSF